MAWQSIFSLWISPFFLLQILGGNPLDRMGHQRLRENKHTPLRWAVASRKILLLHSLLSVLRACTLIVHCWVLALTMVDNHWWWLSHSWSYVEILKTGVFSAGRVIKYPPTVVLLLCSSADRRVSCFWALVKLSLRYIVVKKSRERLLKTHTQFLQEKQLGENYPSYEDKVWNIGKRFQTWCSWNDMTTKKHR